jgi:hypothetical protein
MEEGGGRRAVRFVRHGDYLRKKEGAVGVKCHVHLYFFVPLRRLSPKKKKKGAVVASSVK